MKQKTKEVYYCDHCKKHGLSKFHIARHEKYCINAPENRHACWGCSNLKKDAEEIDVEHASGLYCGTRKVCRFTCTKLNKLLYSVHAERLELLSFPQFDEAERMPRECEHFTTDYLEL